MMRRLILLLLLLSPGLAGAATLIGVVSERSAAEVAAGAHRFMDQHAGHRVLLRTPEQLADKTDSELRSLLQQGDALLLAAVFGDQVPRLERLIRELQRTEALSVLGINADRRLVRLSRLPGRAPLDTLDEESLDTLTRSPDPEADHDQHQHREELAERFPDQAGWLLGRAYYTGRTPENMAGLMALLLNEAGADLALPEPRPREPIRYYRHGETVGPGALELDSSRPVVAVLDLDTGDRPGDRDLLDAACEAVEARDMQCVAVLSRWGAASRAAVENLAPDLSPASLNAIISLQDFVVGGGDGREAVDQALAELDVPVLKGIRLTDLTEAQWRMSEDGLPRDSVHYRLAMPELQGISQPLVLAVAEAPEEDPRTGIMLHRTAPIDDRVERLAGRVQRWVALQRKDNADKRVAIVYYNHPPGRHNVGADNLDVPASLFHILHRLQAAGYDTGPLPETEQELLDAIQDRGVNLPEDRAALEDMSGRVPGLSAAVYEKYLSTLPAAVRGELTDGPLGYLDARLRDAVAARELDAGRQLLNRTMSDLGHVVQAHDHRARERALDLLAQLEAGYERLLDGKGSGWSEVDALRQALQRTGIPGLTGWGEPPGRSMAVDGRFLFPGLQFGKVFIGPQPPRGWEVSEDLLHANMSFPPTHQYMAFYHWLRDHYKADALVYLGRHSTREFLPRRRAGLTDEDYPDLLGGDLPLIYPYIVDGVGEGIQAKRRAMGVMISHLTPPLSTTSLYDELLELRSLVETYEAALDPDSPSRVRAVRVLRERIQDMNLAAEVEAEIANDHGIDVAEVDIDTVDEELLVHEIGHYVTEMQERFMPLGLHVFGRDWDTEAVDVMLESMAGDGEPQPDTRNRLVASPAAELDALLAGLDGRFIAPGQGNDPIRTPEVLPTGRNFHALSSDLLPTRIAWELGAELAAEARKGPDEGSEALVLWASDTVRDEGVMIAFGMDMLGVRPVWNSRGIVKGLERLPMESRRGRRDVVFTTSGLFRDLYGDQLEWLDLAVRLALDGASETIRREHPALSEALDAALAPLGDLSDPGGEALDRNAVAAVWVEDARAALEDEAPAALAGRQAVRRLYGVAPGAYGAGVNRLVERSGAWEDRSEIADAYLARMGHVYGVDAEGESDHTGFRTRLQRVERTYLGRASHLYGLLDNNDGFDYLGGLGMAVERVSGQAPTGRMLQHADADNARVEPLTSALLGELRGRNLNPAWIQPLMEHGYAGARTMGSDFVEYLWGWQVTSPEIVRSWVWDEVAAVYLDDRHGIGVDEFLSEPHNAPVLANIQAVLLVAAHRGFWDASPERLEALKQDFAALAVEYGLPGSGHTRPDHPMLDWVAEALDQELREAFDAARDRARGPIEPQPEAADPATMAEVVIDNTADTDKEAAGEPEDAQPEGGSGEGKQPVVLAAALLLAVLILFGGGVIAGRRRRG